MRRILGVDALLTTLQTLGVATNNSDVVSQSYKALVDVDRAISPSFVHGNLHVEICTHIFYGKLHRANLT